MQLLTLQLSEMKAERIILLDRLALLGLGGTLFSSPPSQDSSANGETEEEVISPEEEEEAYLRSLRRTPSKYAAALTSKLFRAANRMERPNVARIPDLRMSALLSEAEANGKKQA